MSENDPSHNQDVSIFGGPLLYDAKYHPEQARKYCLLGATNKQIAHYFEVSDKTIESWMVRFPEFKTALKEGREVADANVANSLYRRAIGYTVESEKVYADPRTGDVVRVPIIETVLPDPGSAKMWLSARKPNMWRETKNVVNVIRRDASEFSDEELVALTGTSGSTEGTGSSEGSEE